MGRSKIISDVSLLHHAREVFLERGSTASTKEIAKRAKISEATIFKRFPTKASLFLAAMVPPKLDVAEVVDMTGLENRPKEALQRVSTRMVAEFKARIPIVRRLLEHPDVHLQDVTAHLGQRSQRPIVRLSEALAAKLDQLQNKKLVRRHDSYATASLLVSAVHNLVAFEFAGQENSKAMRDAVDAFVNAVWIGLEPNSQRSRKKEGQHD
jgi:AcrR family transcriptional regulator